MKRPLRPTSLFLVSCFCACICMGAKAEHPGGSLPAPDRPTASAAATPEPGSVDLVAIPGPLRSFLRMAGISQEAPPEDVLPLLARNISLHGYQNGGETEYLALVRRYVDFAKELRQLADAHGDIRVENCDDAERLVDVLGYQFAEGCGEKNAYVVTANAERAFLAIDSGFPLTALEDALQKHQPFVYPFPATPVPVIFHEQDWTSISIWRQKGGTSLLDALLHDRQLDILYWGLSKNDEETRSALRQGKGGLRWLLADAPALDFYGSQLSIRSGRVMVPGGPQADHAWQELVGASPSNPSEFTDHLFSKDRGWLAAYFDALSRVSHGQQVQLTSGSRLRQLYDVYRRASNNQYATRGVFPRNADLLILFSRLRWQPDGTPYIPGSLGVWKDIFSQGSTPKMVHDWVRSARSWDSPEQLLITLVACSNLPSEGGPLQIYLTLSAIDSARGSGMRLDDGTVRVIANKFADYRSWYLVFSEFPELNDTSVLQFAKAADAVSAIGNPALRSNALGALQANIGLWEILARQQQIAPAAMNQSWQDTVHPFIGATNSAQVFEATRNSLRATMTAASGQGNLSEDQLVELLAGPAQQDETGRRVHAQIAQRIRSVLDDQRLVSLDTLFSLYDGMDQLAHGAAVKDELIPMAGSLKEFEMPRAIFTAGEKAAWAPEIYTSRHTELQVRTDLTKQIEGASPAQLEAARGELTPFLRDTLVGLNYAYYEPPGAQVLHNNPLFVRSHDFSGASIQGYGHVWNAPELVGIGVTAGGGAYLIGSLANLPYALATAEEDFIAPEHVQALIWQAAGPAILVDAIEPRWWDVSPAELHAAALYQKTGEELLQASPGNEELRGRVASILGDLMSPRRLELTQHALLKSTDVAVLMPGITPAEKFYLAAEYRRLYPSDAGSFGPASQELEALARKSPADVEAARLSKDFGVPHPTLEQTNACAILTLKPLPAYSGDAYGLMGESWESSNLYWARLADEMGYAPESLNVLIPELSRRMIAKIFATDLEDWPAILRAMEQTGEEFRQGGFRIAGVGPVPGNNNTSSIHPLSMSSPTEQ